LFFGAFGVSYYSSINKQRWQTIALFCGVFAFGLSFCALACSMPSKLRKKRKAQKATQPRQPRVAAETAEAGGGGGCASDDDFDDAPGSDDEDDSAARAATAGLREPLADLAPGPQDEGLMWTTLNPTMDERAGWGAYP
jgi:hypothetical protein